jgi:hypothetical protein
MNTLQALRDAEADYMEASALFFSLSLKLRDEVRSPQVTYAYDESTRSYRRLVQAQEAHDRALRLQEEEEESLSPSQDVSRIESEYLEGSSLAPQPERYRTEREYLEALDKYHDSILGNF